jgi:hypothetical protein
MFEHYLILGGFVGTVILAVVLRHTVGKDQPDAPNATLL